MATNAPRSRPAPPGRTPHRRHLPLVSPIFQTKLQASPTRTRAVCSHRDGLPGTPSHCPESGSRSTLRRSCRPIGTCAGWSLKIWSRPAMHRVGREHGGARRASRTTVDTEVRHHA
ncbi:hypothetical protein YWIDRAFT_08058 [Streptomyces sp. SceaMP-e96]|nr:hypothetical protein YWIDRAFT_08058 [Streptomyces sp. SceaMP-e96]